MKRIRDEDGGIDSDDVDYTDDGSLVKIDIRMLEVEAARQPGLTEKYGRKLADAEKLVDDLEAELDVTEADLWHAFAREPEKYDLPNTTVKTLEMAVVTHKRHKKAIAALNEAKHDKAILRAVCKALDHRRDSIEGLIKLLGMSYFSAPRLDKDMNETLQSSALEQTKLNKRRKK